MMNTFRLKKKCSLKAKLFAGTDLGQRGGTGVRRPQPPCFMVFSKTTKKLTNHLLSGDYSLASVSTLSDKIVSR